MASVVERIPTAEIRAQAREVRPGRALLTLVTGLLFALGWLVGKTVTVVALVVLWSAAAVKVGWREARPREPAR